MRIKKIVHSDKAAYILLFIIAFLVIFNSTYNPLNFRRMHVDSSNYATIAQGINRGYLPYRDFVDNKGPLTYFISAVGLRIGGFTGIWIVELVFMFVSVLFAYKTALFFGNRLMAMTGTVFSFVALLVVFTVSAGTEEYSLPFLMISLYIFTKYFFNAGKDTNFFELTVLGACFSCAILIRLNMFPLWIGFCLVIFIESLIQRRFALLIKYTLGFCLGIIIAFVPVFFYLRSNGILNAFLNQVVFAGAARGFSGGGLKGFAKNFYIVASRNFSALLLFFGLFMSITRFRQSRFLYYLAYTISCLLMILFLSFSSGSSHYNMVLIPFYVPALVLLANFLYTAFSGIHLQKTVLVLFLCFVFSEGLVNYLYDLTKIFNDNSGNELINAGKMIDAHTKPGDKIISLGFNGYIYPFTRRDAASKYIYQGSGLGHIPGAREEFVSDILTGKPAIIALFNGEDGIGQIMNDWHSQIFKMIETDYRILSNENGFILYLRQ